ncbi:MAG: toxin-antitoxin system HicB family antitoxin [Anaerolineae bacterium]|nr:toxin-antitoxin system HicB family antitoxin [Anaerolineae bacterium]
MATLHLRIPDYLHKMAREVAKTEGISVNQLITLAVAEKLSALATESYLEERAKRGSREKYEAALAKVSDVEPEEYDRLD